MRDVGDTVFCWEGISTEAVKTILLECKLGDSWTLSFQVFLENLEHEDSFVYLSAIQGKQAESGCLCSAENENRSFLLSSQTNYVAANTKLLVCGKLCCLDMNLKKWQIAWLDQAKSPSSLGALRSPTLTPRNGRCLRGCF